MPARTAPDARQAQIDHAASAESNIDEPDVEPIVNGVVDLGRIVYEELASRLDPYPRLEGVSLDRTDAGAPVAADHPFARLAGLKPAPKSS